LNVSAKGVYEHWCKVQNDPKRRGREMVKNGLAEYELKEIMAFSDVYEARFKTASPHVAAWASIQRSGE
jgi:hypothetical protein